MPKDEFTEVVIERQQNAVLSESGFQDDRIRFARKRVSRMNDLVSLTAKPLHDPGWKILVGKKAFAHADFAGGSR